MAAVLPEAAQADRRLVQQAAHHRSRDRLDARQVAGRGRLPAPGVLGEHLLHQGVAVLAQGAHRGQRVELAEPAGEALDLLLHDLERLGRLLRACAEVALHDALQVVDVVEAHPLQLAAAGIDVPRHRDVDE